MEAYELIDLGDGARLERFGEHVTDRPLGGSLAPRRAPERWADADLRFDRDAGWTTRDGVEPRPWPIHVAGLTLELRPTEAGQVGLFPEHRLTLDWLTGRVGARAAQQEDPPEILHLFAYTGLATLAMARAGAAVAHVDASRPTVAWARANAALSRLTDRPIRWLVDDAPDFVARELRRERRYDGIVLDPPTYGHGTKGARRWQIGEDLAPLLAMCARLLADDGFVLLSAHSEDFGPDELGRGLRVAGRPSSGTVETGELALTADSGGRAVLGAYARWDRGA
ncbi:MAG: class I SAM-dependent methyltransferase [Candidatus Limnocylindrales bacterium]